MSDSQDDFAVGLTTALTLFLLMLTIGLGIMFDGTFLGSLLFALFMLSIGGAAIASDEMNIIFRIGLPLGVLSFGLSGIARVVGWGGLGLTLLAIVVVSVVAEILSRRRRAAAAVSSAPPSAAPTVEEVDPHHVAASVEIEPDATLRAILANHAEVFDSAVATESEEPVEDDSQAHEEVLQEEADRGPEPEVALGPGSGMETDLTPAAVPEDAPQPTAGLEQAPEPERTPEVDVEELIQVVAAVAPEASGDDLAREAMAVVGPLASSLEGSIHLAARAFVAGRSASSTAEVLHEKASSTGAHATGFDVPAASPPRSDPPPQPPAAVVPTRPSDAEIAEAPRCYRVGRLWTVRITVDEELRSTSKASIPVIFAQHIEATGETTSFRTLGDLRLTVNHADDGPVLTGVGELVEHLGLVAGDEALLFAPAWRGRPVTVRPIVAADLARLRPAQRATRLMGLTARSTATTLPLAVGLKRTASLADVIEVLHRRGEDDLVELLRSDPVPFHHGTDPVRPPRHRRADESPQKHPPPGREPNADEPSAVTERESEDDAEKPPPSGPQRRRQKSAAPRSRKKQDAQDPDDAERPDKPDVSDIADILGL